jgi:hypothetical protein
MSFGAAGKYIQSFAAGVFGIQEDQLGNHLRTLMKELATSAIAVGAPMLMKAILMAPQPTEIEYDGKANRYYI